MPKLKRILLVEDDPNDRELIMTGFAASNLANEICAVGDGKLALEYLTCTGEFAGRSDGNPVLVLLDLKLPKVSGLEVLRQMKDNDNLRRVPVVILSSSREDWDIVEGYKLGASAYVVKPVDFHQFIDAVKTIGTFWAILNEPPAGSGCRMKQA